MSRSSSFPLPLVLDLLFMEERMFTHRVEVYDSWVILGAARGSFRYGLGRKDEGFCEAGEFVLCPPGISLYRRALEDINFYYIRFRWKTDRPDFWKGKHALADRARMNSTLGCLKSMGPHPAPGRDSIIAGHFVGDLLCQRLFERRQSGLQPKKAVDRRMAEAAGILENLSEALQLEELAERMKLTPPEFSRKFKKEFGISPAQYRTNARMNLARKLLVETELSLQEIAETCGYENAFYFSRVFSRENGRAPSRFRKSLRV